MTMQAGQHEDLWANTDEYITVPTAAVVLGIKASAMRELLDTGRIPFIVPLKQRRVRLADVIRYRNDVSRRGAGPRRKLRLKEDLLAD